MKFKRGCFDKIDWNTWMPDSDVNENKRLEIGSTSSFSGVLLFSFFLFSLFFLLGGGGGVYLILWISCVNDSKTPLFYYYYFAKLKDAIAGFCQKYKLFIYQLCLLGKSSQKRSFLDFLDRKERFLDQKSEVLIKVQIIEVFPRD